MRVDREARWRIYDLLKFKWMPIQEAFCADTTHVFRMLGAGVGAGKSMSLARDLLPEVLIEPNRLYWLVGPDFDQARAEFDWLLSYLKELLPPEELGVISMPKDGDWTLSLPNGVVVETKTAKRPNSLHSRPVDGIVGCEAGQLDEFIVRNRMIPRILRGEQHTGWMTLGGTFEGGNTFFAQKFNEALRGDDPNWAAYSMASWENTISFPGGRNNWQIVTAEKELSPEEFMQRYGAVPMSPQGVVFKEFSRDRHVFEDVEYNPELPVQIWVDPGDTYAVSAVQIDTDSVVNVIDEVYIRGGSTEQAVRQCITRPWWDAVQTGWIDIAALEARGIWASGAIWNQVSQEQGRRLIGIPLNAVRVSIDAGTERVRTLLHTKVFDHATQRPVWTYAGQDGISRIRYNPRCIESIHEYALYQKAKDALVDGSRYIDKYNHHIKSMVYGCVGNFGYNAPYIYSPMGYVRRRLYGVTR